MSLLTKVGGVQVSPLLSCPPGVEDEMSHDKRILESLLGGGLCNPEHSYWALHQFKLLRFGGYAYS